jgi:two-component sensor histidine kinase
MSNEKLKVVFEPGCFDNLDMTQEELDDLVSTIQAMAESGELFENSKELTDEDIDELPEDIKKELLNMLSGDNDRIVH